MNRREYWETRLGNASTFKTSRVARLLGKSTRTIQRLLKNKEIPSTGGKRNKTRVVQRADLLDYLLRLEEQNEN